MALSQYWGPTSMPLSRGEKQDMHPELNLSSKGVQTQSNSAEEDEFMLSPSLKAPLLGSLPGFAGGNQREFRGKGRGLSRHSDLAVTEPGGRGSGYEPP